MQRFDIIMHTVYGLPSEGMWDFVLQNIEVISAEKILKNLNVAKASELVPYFLKMVLQ